MQTNKRSAFGEISQMEVTSKYYIIWDAVSNSILFFTKEGRFFTKITNTDKSVKTPYKKINQFTVNEQKNELVFNDVHSPYLYFYTLEGKFIKNIEKPDYIGSTFISFADYSLYLQGYDSSSSKSLQIPPSNLIITKDGEKKAWYLPFDTLALNYTDLFTVGKSFYNNQNGIIHFSTTYDYNIYSIDSSAHMFNSFRFVMPATNAIPNDFMIDAKYKDKRMAYTNSNEEVIYSVTDFYQNNNDITFRLFGHSINQTFSYNLKTGNLKSLSNIVSDKFTYMLPIIKRKIHALDSRKNLISSIDAITLFDAKFKLGGNKTWDSSLPASLKEFFKSDNQQNEVLTIMRLKQENLN